MSSEREEPISRFRERACSFISGQRMKEEATVVPGRSGGGDPSCVILGKLCELIRMKFSTSEDFFFLAFS